MWFLKDKPIKRKVTLVILWTASAALLVTAGALFAFQLFNFRQNFTRDLAALGEIIANHSTAAVAFKDKQTAKEMLHALQVKPHIVRALVLLQDGTVFAEYGKPVDSGDAQITTGASGLHFQGGHLVFYKPIILDHEKIGSLYLQSDYDKELRSLLKLYAGILVLVLTFSILLTLLLSARLQRVISEPILRLAETAQVIADKKDYSVRVQRLERDEIGLFTDAFNQMLEQIQAQDAAIRVSQQKFETLVHSIDGIVWEADPATLRFAFVSQQAERLLGYPVQQWVDQANFWEQHLHADDCKSITAHVQQAIRQLKPFALEYRVLAADGRVVWVRNNTSITAENGQPTLLRGVMLDITDRRKAEHELEELHKQLVVTSRQAGMAEVATGVLHNVGNVLNSVNVSATLVCDLVRRSEAASLTKVTQLLQEHSADLGSFMTAHPKGKLLPGFLAGLSGQLDRENAEALKELQLLTKNVEHIKDIVAMQQSYAKCFGMIEELPASEMVDDALQINATALTRHSIRIIREFQQAPKVAVDKHKVLQILVNLIRNAKYAMDEAKVEEKNLVLGIAMNGPDRVKITVRDNGIGIKAENLTRIFAHGFTTKRDGHGFGLHSGALAAREMGGGLTAYSDGPGTGATFTLDLPVVKGRIDK